MKEVKSDRRSLTVSLVKLFDAGRGSVENFLVAGHFLGWPVREIRQQRKVKMFILVRQPGDFEFINQRRNRRQVVEDHRHYHHRPGFSGHAF